MIKAERDEGNVYRRSSMHADDAVTQWNICSIVVCQPFSIIIKESKESFIDSVWAYNNNNNTTYGGNTAYAQYSTNILVNVYKYRRIYECTVCDDDGGPGCCDEGVRSRSLAVTAVCSPCELEIHILMCVTNFMMHFPFDGEN